MKIVSHERLQILKLFNVCSEFVGIIIWYVRFVALENLSKHAEIYNYPPADLRVILIFSCIQPSDL